MFHFYSLRFDSILAIQIIHLKCTISMCTNLNTFLQRNAYNGNRFFSNICPTGQPVVTQCRINIKSRIYAVFLFKWAIPTIPKTLISFNIIAPPSSGAQFCTIYNHHCFTLIRVFFSLDWTKAYNTVVFIILSCFSQFTTI